MLGLTVDLLHSGCLFENEIHPLSALMKTLLALLDSLSLQFHQYILSYGRGG